MRQKELIRVMDAVEIRENIAYDMLQDKKFKERMQKEISIAEQENQTPEEEGLRIGKMFRSIATVIKREG